VCDVAVIFINQKYPGISAFMVCKWTEVMLDGKGGVHSDVSICVCTRCSKFPVENCLILFFLHVMKMFVIDSDYINKFVP
jgi:hypothetical protein